MKITIRTRELKNGSRSIYLDFYEKGKRWNEFLNLFLVPDNAPDAKRLNDAVMSKANEIKSKRMLGIEEDVEEENDVSCKLPKRVFAEWLDCYVERIRLNPTYAVSTYNNYYATARMIKAYLKHRRRPRLLMSKIDKKFILGLLDYMQNTYKNTKSPDNPQELSPQTLHARQILIVRMLNAAVKEGVLLSNPFYSLKKNEIIGKQKPDRDYLTKEEVRAMAKAPTVNETTKRAFLFCCFTGLRYSDVCQLSWRDIRKDDSGWAVSLRAMKKTGKPVVVPLNQSAISWLPDVKNRRPSEKVFSMTGLSACDKCLKKMAEAAGIEKDVSFHTTRHSFAVLTLAAGGDLYTVSKLLGHTNINSTQVYADVVMDTKIEAVNLITNYFSKGEVRNR